MNVLRGTSIDFPQNLFVPCLLCPNIFLRNVFCNTVHRSSNTKRIFTSIQNSPDSKKKITPYTQSDSLENREYLWYSARPSALHAKS